MPVSATGPWTGRAGVATFFLVVPALPFLPLEWHWLALLLVGCIAGAMIGVDTLLYKVPQSQARSQRNPLDIARILRKLLALFTAWILVYLPYRFFSGSLSGPFADCWRIAETILPTLALLALPYFVWQDRRQHQPEDEYHHAGLLLVGRWREANWEAVGQFVRGWMVKGFFLPLMITFLIDNVRRVATAAVWQSPPSTFVGVVDAGLNLLFALDVSLAVVGYAFAFKALGTHIRSSEPTFTGWTACLVCYPPFWGQAKTNALNYDDQLAWGEWLREPGLLQTAWGGSILALIAIYVWATAAFGLRFSNLTHRGIITHGPYRWLRHPAYVSKNLSWWLISVPFISDAGWNEALKNCGQLLCVNLIYALRAWTEERHLARDPAYRAYRDWMRQHGLLARCLKRVRNGSRPSRPAAAVNASTDQDQD